MAGMFKRPISVRPPEGCGVNWNNPLSQGLERAYNFGSMRGTDETGKQNFSIGGGTPSVVSDGILFDGVGDWLNFGKLAGVASAQEITAMYAITPTANDSMVMAQYDYNGAADDLQPGWVSTTGNAVRVAVESVAEGLQSGSAMNLNERHTCIMTYFNYDNVGNRDLYMLYRNGFREFKDTDMTVPHTGTNPFNANEDMLCGVDPDGAGNTSLGNWFTGVIHYAYIWARGLDEGEMQSLYRDRLQLFNQTQYLSFAGGNIAPIAFSHLNKLQSS